MYDPIQELLDLVKSAKVSSRFAVFPKKIKSQRILKRLTVAPFACLISRKIVRRVEDVVKSSSALNVELLEPLQALTDHVSNSVNFAVQVRLAFFASAQARD
jgi:hypothetical protein